jgi:transcriptional regulator with XRE-family HTH domain
MNPRQIKAHLALHGITVRQLARDVGESEVMVSQVINYLRPNERIRKKLALRLGIPLKKLFDPKIKCQPAHKRNVA